MVYGFCASPRQQVSQVVCKCRSSLTPFFEPALACQTWALACTATAAFVEESLHNSQADNCSHLRSPASLKQQASLGTGRGSGEEHLQCSQGVMLALAGKLTSLSMHLCEATAMCLYHHPPSHCPQQTRHSHSYTKKLQ